MEWIALVTLLLQFFGPLLLEWLQELLKKAGNELKLSGDNLANYGYVEAENILWERASLILQKEIDATPWYNVFGHVRNAKRQRIFRKARLTANKQSGCFAHAAIEQTNNLIQPLTLDETKQILSA